MDPSKTLAGRLYKESEKSSQSEVATCIAKENYKKSWDKPYQLTGFTDMELSTQILMFDAIQQGIQGRSLGSARSIFEASIKRSC